MHPRTPAGRFAAHGALLFLLPFATGCGPGAAGTAAVDDALAAQIQAARLPDGLLDSPELRRIVDLQVARDAEGLIAQLADGSPSVRARALHALASVQDSAAVPAILPLLRDPEWTVRRDAALALGQARTGVSASALLEALEREEGAEVRRRLTEALGKVGSAAALARLHDAAARPGEAAERMLAYARFGIRDVHHPAVVRTLSSALEDPDPGVRANAAYYFGRVTNVDAWRPVAGDLRAALDGLEPTDTAAMYLLAGLARLADPADRERFTWWAVEGGDERIRTNAVQALGSQPDGARARGALLDALGDRSAHVGGAAATALSGRELPGGELERVRRRVASDADDWRVATPLLAPLVRAGHTEVVIDWMNRREPDAVEARSRAVAALATAPGDDAFRALLAAAAASHPRLRAAGVSALATRWPAERRTEERHAAYFEAFRGALEVGNAAAIRAAASVLATDPFRPFGARELLETSFRGMSASGDSDRLAALVDVFGEVGDVWSLALVREATTHPHPTVRSRSVRALERATGAPAANGSPAGGSEAASAAASAAAVDWEALRALGRHPRLVLETTRGRIVVALAAEEAPMTVQAIAGHARAGRYDRIPFHRVVPNFVIQGGDFRRREGGGEGEPPPAIRSEFNGIPFKRGVIGMASSGKDTETSQFFVTHSMQPHLDGGYTAFGWVIEGMDVVDAILEDDRIVRARVENGAP